jgi:hypothetical protein
MNPLIERLKKILEFYADERRYFISHSNPIQETDRGRTAREALMELNEHIQEYH